MSQFSDPEFLREAYGTDEGLTIRTEAHRRYSLMPVNIFDELTRHALARNRPSRILDIGAGTGSWYARLRPLAGDAVEYRGLDQSPAMVAALTRLVSHDPNAGAELGDALALPYSPGSFDWVGLHYMLYHVADVRQALWEAWSVVRPGGLLIAAGHGDPQYPELFALHAEAAHALGLPFDDQARDGRFSLDSGSPYFPQPPEVHRYQGGLQFPTAAAFLAYYGSGFCWSGLPLTHHTPEVRRRLLDTVGKLVEPILATSGSIHLSHTAGFFLVQKLDVPV